MRRPFAVVLSAVLALVLGGERGATAASVRPVMPGFTAERIGEFGAACSGDGPTALAIVNDVAFVATDTGLYYTARGGLSSYKGENQARPWGLTVLGGKLYGTTPRCGTEPGNDPVGGSNCNVVEIFPSNGRARVVADVCGYGVAADPDTGTLTVTQRDGQVVAVDPATGAATDLFSKPSARRLAWSSDGRRLFLSDEAGAVFVWERSGAPRRMSGVSGRGLAAGTSSVGLDGSLLVGAPGVVRAVPGGDVASSGGEQASALAAGQEGIHAAFRSELWLLRGRHSPPPPPPPPTTPPPSTPPARVAAPVAQPNVPPVAPPQAPPPPPPPAPPVPPLATAAQVAAQPSVVANPAIVPGEAEREAALRLAATRADGPLAPTMLWLGLAGAACLGGFTVGRFGVRRSHAWAWAWGWASTK